MKIPVIVLFAPTATGKTALALRLFGKSSHSFFKDKCELISADSMQVYRGLDIGTAKPSLEEQKELVHHLIDVRNMDEQWTAADFVQESDRLCAEIFARKRIPLIAGGTGFYIRNFILGMPKTPPSDENIKLKLSSRLESEGLQSLYKELCSVDSESALKINKNDAFRILRALEIFYLTGKPRSDFCKPSLPRNEYEFLILILERNRDILYERINERVCKMFDDGLQSEINELKAKGARKDFPAMQAIGYSQWFEYDDVEVIKERIQHDSRKYAKKQWTFMKNIPGAVFLDANDSDKLYESVQNKIQEFIDKINLNSMFTLDQN